MRVLSIATITIVFLGAPAAARTWHVPADAHSIAAALALAEPSDVVEVACGTYHEHGLTLKPGVTLRSQTGEPDCVTIDAENLDSVIVAEDLAVAATVEGLTLTHGLAQGLYPSGGGLVSRAAAVSVRRCRFVDNAAGWGGGLHAWNSRLEVADCEFIGNQASVGAAGIDCTGGAPSFANCALAGNHSVATSSTIRIAHAVATFANCHVFANDLPPDGTVLVGFDSRLAMSGSVIGDQPQGGVHGVRLQAAQFAGSGNVISAIDGTALSAAYNSTVILDHTTLAANGQGLVLAENSRAMLHACLVAFQAQAGITASDADLEVTCCDIFGNAGGDYAGDLADQTGRAGNISADPLFCNLAAGDLGLGAGSPALPAGNLCYTQIGAFGQSCGAAAVPPASPRPVTLAAPSPNPFNPRTTLTFTLSADAPANLEIYSLDGARIARLLEGPQPAGTHVVTWDGLDTTGRAVAAGVYVARLVAAGDVSVQRLALVR